MPPFTMEAQRWIWERQNPPPSRCREQKFLLGYVEVRHRLCKLSFQQILWMCYFSRFADTIRSVSAGNSENINLT